MLNLLLSLFRSGTPKKVPLSDTTSETLKDILWHFKRRNYHTYLKSPKWKAKRYEVLRRAGFKCYHCSKTATEVHHKTYKHIYKERLSDLMALCRKCHEKKHKRRI